jgi:carbonic anhydrase
MFNSKFRLSNSTLVITSGSLIWMLGCADTDSGMSMDGDGDGDAAPGGMMTAETHWSYDGDSGPTHWAELDPDWALCAAGKSQSPIEIPQETVPMSLDDLSFAYQASPLALVNNGHTVQVNYSPGSHISFGGVEYELAQFHFHAHSEHRLGGQFAPLEAHLVHRSSSGALAVVGVLIDEGDENAALATVFSHLPKQSGGTEQVSESTFNASELLPAAHGGFRYEGSLTTPPCTEGVHWQVLAEPVYASPAQIAAFTALYANDARPLQALESRHVN